MAVSQNSAQADAVQACDPVWTQMRSEADGAVKAEPALGGFIFGNILGHEKLEIAVAHRVAQRLGSSDVDSRVIVDTFQKVLETAPRLAIAFRADLSAVYDRDPACARYMEPMLYFKGFHALVAYRFAHLLHDVGRKDLAFYLQSQSSRVFNVDIHPGARIGIGIMLDHATGFVVGETAVVGDNCSFLHGVTLGGSGKETGDRHPKIADNVLIGAGAKVLGNITIGECSRVAAGSVVLKDVPRNVTVAGVPAKVVGPAGCPEPSRTMDQRFESGDWTI
ncbi:MAG: serine O-acetyltransferase [Hyphomicrobiaceae bacterium]